MNSINTMTKQKQTVKLAKMGMLVAISIVLVALIHFPIIPAVPFMEYDPADIPILLGTFAFGPARTCPYCNGDTSGRYGRRAAAYTASSCNLVRALVAVSGIIYLGIKRGRARSWQS